MYSHMTFHERQSIEIHLKRWSSQKEIAEVLRRNEWSISREIRRNSVRKLWNNMYEYLSREAQLKSYQRRRLCKTQSMKINMNTQMKDFIIEQLSRSDMELSPKIIANMWNNTQTQKKYHITHTSIYSWLETGIGNKYKTLLLYKQKWYRKKQKMKWSKIIGRTPIEKRSESINKRQEKGHFEADLIVSKKWYKGSVLTLIDRKTRLPRLFKLQGRSSENIMNLIESIKDEVWIKSVTFDNGMEFAKHSLLKEFGIDTYFCNPYHSREKGSIENLNRIIRRFFPKWTIFDNISHKEIQRVCDILSNTPREILDFKSPNQVHFWTHE